METIISSLIIACSNLVQPVSGLSMSSMTPKEAIAVKKQCIARVNDCVQDFHSGPVTILSPRNLLNKCSDKVY